MKQLLRASLFVMCLLIAAFPGYTQSLPSDITGLQLWLDASDPNGNATLPTDGTTVSSWKDKSGNARHTSLYNSGSGYTSPVYYGNQINGKGVIRFTRTAGTIGSAYSSPMDIRAVTTPEITLFTVYKQGTRSGDQAIWGCDDGAWDRFFFSSRLSTPDNGSVSFGNVSPFTVDVAGAGQLGQVKCLTAVYSKAGGTNGSAIYFNGQLVTPFTDQTTLGTDALAAVRIGLDGNDNFYNGDIAEMIIYNRKLSNCEITQVNRYLNIKYGVSFSAVNITAGGATTFAEGGSVTFSSSSTGTAYQWLKNNAIIGGATSNTYVATEAGDYRLAVTNGCIDTSAAITVTTTIPAPPSTALKLDGINDYIDCGSSISAPTIKTLECWVKFGSLSTVQEIVSKSKTSNGIELLIYNNSLAFFCMNTISNVSHIDYPASNLTTDKWYHIAATWDGVDRTTMRLYVNGVSVGTRVDAGNVGTTGVSDPGVGSKLMVGNWNDGARFFSGSIDEVRVWDKLLTQAELRAAAYDTLPRTTPGLLAYLRMDQGSAGGNNTSITRMKDYSNSNLVCNLTGFSMTGTTSNVVESYAMVAPFPQPANNITSTGFTAVWNSPVTGIVNNYVLDVSTDANFGSFVPGYNARNVGLVNSFAVTSLTNGTTYYYRVRANKTTVNGEGALTYASISATPGTILPAIWESIKVTPVGTTASVVWVTLTELNSDYFTVQRSYDGINYTDIARVNASGESQQRLTYKYIDQYPAIGRNYYRVRMTDKDGSQTYSSVKMVNFAQQSGSVSVFPSPADAHIFIDVQNAKLNNTRCTIYNIQGQPVMDFQVKQGVEKKDITILTPGIYVLKFADKSSIKFVKN
ncbi:MAG: LamG-like jellyroll fold domain-containing protein [Bacteroidota bacterium]